VLGSESVKDGGRIFSRWTPAFGGGIVAEAPVCAEIVHVHGKAVQGDVHENT